MKAMLSHATRRDIVVFLKLIAPFLFILFAGIHFKEFVVHAISVNVAINSGIIAAATYGVLLIMMRLIAAMRDFRVIERFGREAREGGDMKTLLEQPWLKQRYVRHYLSHIALTEGLLASELDQNAIENELHALQSEYDSRLELPQFLVGFMIAMGLLGTFIGLLETLTGISGMLDGFGGASSDIQAQFMKLVSELKKPLAGMGIAFSASMFGLITSLMLSIMMTNLRRYVSRVMALARNVMHDLTKLVRVHGGSVAQVDKEADHASGAGVKSMQNAVVMGRIDLLAKKIDSLLQVIESGTAATQKTNDLLGFGPRMKELSEKSLEEMRGVSARIGEQQAALQSIAELNASSSRTLGAILDAQRTTGDVGAAMNDQLERVSRGLEDQTQLFRQAIELGQAQSHQLGEMIEAHKQANEGQMNLLNETRAVSRAQQDHMTWARQSSESLLQSGRMLAGLVDGQGKGMTQTESVLGELRGLSKALGENRKMGQSLIDIGDATTRAIESGKESERQLLGGVLQTMQSVDQRLAQGEEATIGLSRHVFDIKEKVARIEGQSSTVEALAIGVNGQSAMLEALTDETRRARIALQQYLNANA